VQIARNITEVVSGYLLEGPARFFFAIGEGMDQRDADPKYREPRPLVDDLLHDGQQLVAATLFRAQMEELGAEEERGVRRMRTLTHLECLEDESLDLVEMARHLGAGRADPDREPLEEGLAQPPGDFLELRDGGIGRLDVGNEDQVKDAPQRGQRLAALGTRPARERRQPLRDDQSLLEMCGHHEGVVE